MPIKLGWQNSPTQLSSTQLFSTFLLPTLQAKTGLVSICAWGHPFPKCPLRSNYEVSDPQTAMLLRDLTVVNDSLSIYRLQTCPVMNQALATSDL